jgi:hypothetical protein
MRRKNAAFLFLLTLTTGLLSPGCATLTRGRARGILVTSYPSGATVIVKGRRQGETPLMLRPASGRKGQVIRIECAGYDPVEIRLIKKTSGGFFFGNLLLGLIPATVPAARQSLAHEGEGFLPIWILSAAAFGALFTLADSGTGAINEFEPREITVALKKTGGLSRVDTVLVDADDFRNVKWIRVRGD